MPRPRKPKPFDPVTPASTTVEQVPSLLPETAAALMSPVVAVSYADGESHTLPTRPEPTPGKVGCSVPFWKYGGCIYASELPDFLVPGWVVIPGISDVTDPEEAARRIGAFHEADAMLEAIEAHLTANPWPEGQVVTPFEERFPGMGGYVEDGDDAYLASRDPRTVPGTTEYAAAGSVCPYCGDDKAEGEVCCTVPLGDYEDPPIRCGTFQPVTEADPRDGVRPELIPLGDALRSARENVGMSMGEMAKCLGWTVPEVSDVERGRAFPSVDQYAAYMDCLNVDHETGERMADLYVETETAVAYAPASHDGHLYRMDWDDGGAVLVPDAPHVAVTPDGGLEWNVPQMVERADPIRDEGYRDDREAVCPTCGPGVACDEDRCCATCGRDLVIVSDAHSAEMLMEALAEAAIVRTDDVLANPEMAAAVVRAVQSGKVRLAEWNGHALVSLMGETIGRVPALPNGGHRADFGTIVGEFGTVDEARSVVETRARESGWAIVAAQGRAQGKVKRA